MTESKFEQAKGRAKEALGDLTGDEELEREGKADKASDATKSKMAKVLDNLKKPFRRRR